MQNLVFYRSYTLFKLISSTVCLHWSGWAECRETEIKNRFRSHTWLLFQVSHFILFRHLPWFIQTRPSTGPGSSHVQMCRAYLCFRASFHCTPGFCSSWDASTSASILSVFCFISSALHSFLPSSSPCPSFTLSLQSFSVSLSRLQNLKQKWVRAFRLVT